MKSEDAFADEEAVVAARFELGPPEGESFGRVRHGTERATGAAVLAPEQERVHWPWSWPRAVEAERVAALIASGAVPHTLPVLMASPEIVYAAPPPDARPDGPMDARDAVECALALCEAVAHAHAWGIAGISIAPYNAFVVREGEQWGVRVALPPLPSRSKFGDEPYPYQVGLTSPDDAIRADVWRIAVFLRGLLIAPPARTPRRDPRRAMPGNGRSDQPATFPRGLLQGDPTAEGAVAVAEHTAGELDRVLAGSRDHWIPANPAALASLLVPFARSPSRWRSRVDALPAAAHIPAPRRDWDRMIERGERMRVRLTPTQPNPAFDSSAYATLPLAAAYHQRACQRHAAGDLAGALADCDRAVALDPYLAYHTTRAVLRDALGDRAGAAQDIDSALASEDGRADRPGAAVLQRAARGWHRDESGGPPRPVDLARAHYVRGLARLRARDHAAAAQDLARAVALDPCAEYAHALGLACAGLGRTADAARWAQRAVAREPGRAPFEWALARALVALGRREEARAVGERVVAREPAEPRHRARLARLLA